MRVRHLIFVGLLVCSLLAPTTSTWADTGAEDGSIWTGWVETVVQWVSALVSGNDPNDPDTEAFTLDSTTSEEELQSVQPADDERHGGLSPDGRTAS